MSASRAPKAHVLSFFVISSSLSRLHSSSADTRGLEELRAEGFAM